MEGDHDISTAAGIPLPVSTAVSPTSTPYRKSRNLNWFRGPVYTSPEVVGSRLSVSQIEIVPPTPPRDHQIDEEFIVGSPRESIMSTPGPAGRRSRVMNRMNRMSQTFHSGTPPPAIRMLHPEDARQSASRPVSNTFIREGKRSSIYAQDDPRRQSVVSWRASQYHAQQEPPIMEMGRPPIEHRETNSDETYVTEMTDPLGSASGSSPPRKKRRPKADPLTILERRRRRDFTIGSHNPLHPPPVTPVQSRPQSMATDTSEIQSVKLGDVVERFKSIFHRFGDMPWISDPVCATLIIPRSAAKEAQPVAWYRPKPTIDELVGESDSATIAPPGTAQMKWFPQHPEPTHLDGRERFSDAIVTRVAV